MAPQFSMNAFKTPILSKDSQAIGQQANLLQTFCPLPRLIHIPGVALSLASVMLASLFSLFSSCSFLVEGPEKKTQSKRIQALSRQHAALRSPVKIYWNDWGVPFIHAQTDQDLAYTLGLIHAHLRLNQLEVYRHVSQGRLAELAGPLAADIDHGLRLLNFPQAAAEIIEAMKSETKTWAQAFLQGLNAYITELEEIPPDLRALGVTPRPWRFSELIGVWRLMSTDVNWLTYFKILQIKDPVERQKVWRRFLQNGSEAQPSFSATGDGGVLGELPWFFSRSGSNALVVSEKKSAGPSALISNDPHLGTSLPNIWLLAGYKSPSFHAVGMMIPGLPALALGRNLSIAWGGTNMRGLSSYLIKLSGQSVTRAHARQEKIKIRWWPDKDLTIRQSEYGPIISDHPYFDHLPPLALWWKGHQPSDELSALLAANKAKNFAQFRQAFSPYSVSAQNFLYADTKGNIGQVAAYEAPLVEKKWTDKPWIKEENFSFHLKTSTQLPYAFNPKKGFLASANNPPFYHDPPVGRFFALNDRYERLSSLASEQKSIDLARLKKWHRDVYSPSSWRLKNAILQKTKKSAALSKNFSTLVKNLKQWDGHYRANSPWPVFIENCWYSLAHSLLKGDYEKKENFQKVLQSSYWRPQVLQRLISLSPQESEAPLAEALKFGQQKTSQYPTWGQFHRLSLGGLLKNVPLIGGQWELWENGVPGSYHTLHKTASRPAKRPQDVFYGANARYVSDLSDPNENYFVLLGGQDGWFTAQHTLDQVSLWRQGQYIRFPLELSEIRQHFNTVTTLAPRSTQLPPSGLGGD